MLIIDGDYPMAFGALDLNRDLTKPIEEVRAAPQSSGGIEGWPNSEAMASLPEMRRGRIAAALVKVVGRIERPGNPLRGYRSGDNAFAAAQAHLAYYRILEVRGEARILRSSEDFAEHMHLWSKPTVPEDSPVGMVIGMEGADPILWPKHVHDWWRDGLRVVSLCHYGVSTYAHGTGTGTSGGLFPQASALLREMESLGMILDVTHSSDESVRQSLDLFTGPVLASHQNCRTLVSGERQLPDDLLKRVIERGGVIGTSMDAWMLHKESTRDWAGKVPPIRSVFPREAVTLEDVADHMDHVCQLAGNSEHAAIGGDTDGQGGREAAPLEIDTVADYQKLAGVLARRGFGQSDIANVMHTNWQRFFQTWLPSAEVLAESRPTSGTAGALA